MIASNTKISELTVRELVEIIEDVVSVNRGSHKTTHGVKGLADLLGCSYSQAKRIKASGAIDKAITQRGRTIIIDSEKALSLLNFK